MRRAQLVFIITSLSATTVRVLPEPVAITSSALRRLSFSNASVTRRMARTFVPPSVCPRALELLLVRCWPRRHPALPRRLFRSSQRTRLESHRPSASTASNLPLWTAIFASDHGRVLPPASGLRRGSEERRPPHPLRVERRRN